MYIAHEEINQTNKYQCSAEKLKLKFINMIYLVAISSYTKFQNVFALPENMKDL